MRGLPQVFNTPQDWLHAHEYALAAGDERYTAVLKGRLQALRSTDTILVLRDGVTTPPEEQTPADYESILDPCSPLARSGLTAAGVDLLIAQLG